MTNIASTATYRWQRFDDTGENLETDNIGTGATYTLTAADVGKRIRVRVSYTDDVGNNEGPFTTRATDIIAPAAECAAPAYEGGAAQVWKGTLGVERSLSTSLVTLNYGYSGVAPTYGTLDDTTFTADSAHTLRAVRYMADVRTDLRFLALTTTPVLTESEKQQLTLHVCDTPFTFSTVDGSRSGFSAVSEVVTGTVQAFSWRAPAINWSRHSQRTLYISRDQTAPTLSDIYVRENGTQLALNFSETLSKATLTNDAFTVKKTPQGGSEATVTLSSTSAPEIFGRTVFLSLDTSIHGTDTDIKVTYTPPTTGTSNKIGDRFGNLTTGFADRTAAYRERGLLSNIDQVTRSATFLSAYDVVQSFNTGSNSNGYHLTRLQLSLFTTSDIQASDLKVTLVSGSPTGTEVATLYARDPVPEGGSDVVLETVKAVILEPSTTYWVLVKFGSGAWYSAVTTDVDAGTAAGWSMGNVGQARSAGSTSGFRRIRTGGVYQLRVYGAPAVPGVMLQQAPNSPPTGVPGISGTVQLGQTLTATTDDIGDPDGLTNPGFTYQWTRLDLRTNTETNVGNGPTYTVTAEDVGKAILVKVTFTDDAGHEQSLTSNAHVAVSLPPIGGVGGGGLQRDGPQNSEEEQPAAPVITTTGDTPVLEGATFVGLLIATDEDTAQAGLTWSVHGGADSSHFTLTPVGLLTFASAKDFEAPDDADSDGRYEVTVQVTDGTNSVTGDVRAILLNRNEVPAASAGPDQAGIVEGATVTLSGMGTDPDSGDTLSYAWTQTEGATVTLSAPGAALTTFAAPTGLTGDETLRFTLRVSDAGGLSAEDTVEITVVASPEEEESSTRDEPQEEEQSEQTPPAQTASTHDVPASHDGAGEDFVFELRFSESPEEGFSYEIVHDHAFTVTSGSVTYVRRLEAGKNIEWEITVTSS